MKELCAWESILHQDSITLSAVKLLSTWYTLHEMFFHVLHTHGIADCTHNFRGIAILPKDSV